MEISLIISYYKAPQNLMFILTALEKQTESGFEVIISEDDSNPETKQFLSNYTLHSDLHIQHIFQQEDMGFRKNMMLNQACLIAKTDFLVFIDGDCIPHKNFIKSYLKKMDEDAILTGRRVMLGPKFTEQLRQQNSIDAIKLMNIMQSDSQKKKEAIYSPLSSLSMKARGLVGCNWGIKKSHILAVNGFDEDYVRAGVGEDVDIEWRLEQLGLTRKSMKNKAIVYHLHHERGYTDEAVQANFKIFYDKKKLGQIQCVNGINKLT